MIIRLSREILESEEQKDKDDLSYLIKTIVRNFHKISFETDVTEVPQWLDENDRETLEASLAATLIGDEPVHHCEVTKVSAGIDLAKIFNLKEAIEYASSPLSVMVENSNNDRRLILKALDVYTRERSEAYYSNRLAFDHAGGCGSVRNVIDEKLSQNGHRPKMLRYYVILDGDKRYPDHEITKNDTLIAFLRANDIPFHILEKRCMENYLPCEAFPGSKNNTAWIHAFRSLTAQQRDFFNIGGGLKDDLSDENRKLLAADCSNIRELLKTEQQTFFADVSDTNLRRLAKGYEIKSFKEEFPKGFSDPSVTREALDHIQRHQQDPNELKNLAGQILDLL